MRATRWALAAALVGAVLSAPGSVPALAQSTPPTTATAVLSAADGKAVGAVALSGDGDGVLVEVSVSGLSEGFHGFNIHTTGVCDPGDPANPFASAGGHLNPGLTGHGHDAGDLPSVYVRPDGTARAALRTDNVTIDRLLQGDGTAVIVHAGADNFAHIPPRYRSGPLPDATTRETGDSGKALACGVIRSGPAALPAGYFLAAGDGGVFALGTAVFRGSRGGQRLNRPVVGMSATPGGDGYHLAASDGGVFTFGDAGFEGSMGGTPLNAPVVAMADFPMEARARLIDRDGITAGEVRLAEGDGGVRISVTARGLDAGFHGFHVHAAGVCDPAVAFSTAGGHLGASDAVHHPDHPGDLPPLLADQAGHASATFRTTRFHLTDLLGGAGTAFVITRDPDNFANIPDRYGRDPDAETLATGDSDSNGRAACGVVQGDRDGHPLSGYWLVAADGGVFNFGDAPFVGSAAGAPLSRPVVGLAPTPSGNGLWLVAADGGVFTFGDAGFHGSTGGMKLNRDVVGMAATPSGAGYWLVAGDGGVFAFGDAAPLGSLGGTTLNSPVIGMASTASGAGYWLFAADGGVFTFGDAAFAGSMGAIRLNKPMVAAAFAG